MFKDYTKHKSSTKWTEFTKYRNKLSHIIEQSKRNHFKSEIRNNKSNIKKLWQTVNKIASLKQPKQNQKFLISSETGELTNDRKQISNIFNKYFSTIGSKLASTISKPSN